MNRTRLVLALVVAALAATPVLAQGPGGPGGPKGGPGGPGGGPGGPGGGRRGGRGFGRMFNLFTLTPDLKKKLKLTPDQEKKIDAVGEKMRGEFQSMGGGFGGPGGPGGPKGAPKGPGGPGGPGGGFGKMAETAKKYNDEAVKVLNASQKKQFDGWKATHDQLQGLGRSSIAILSVDGLSADQKSKLKSLADKTDKKRQALFGGGPGGPGGPGGAPKGAPKGGAGKGQPPYPGGGPGGPGGGKGGPGGGFEGLRKLDTDTQGEVKKVLKADQAKQFDAAIASMPQRGGRGGGGKGPGGKGPGKAPTKA